MKRPMALAHEFVKAIPDKLEEHTLYVSVEYAMVTHMCCCGCGGEVVTPLSPTDWKLVYDGESISLYPSIGNWSFECRSHYWIDGSEVKWAKQWSKSRIETTRARDRRTKERHYAKSRMVSRHERNPERDEARNSFWSWISKLRLGSRSRPN